MITCRELIEFLMSYVDGDLSPEMRAKFEEHLAVCPPCVRYMDTYKKTVQLGKQTLKPSDDPAPSSVPEGLVQAILAARKKKGG